MSQPQPGEVKRHCGEGGVSAPPSRGEAQRGRTAGKLGSGCNGLPVPASCEVCTFFPERLGWGQVKVREEEDGAGRWLGESARLSPEGQGATEAQVGKWPQQGEQAGRPRAHRSHCQLPRQMGTARALWPWPSTAHCSLLRPGWKGSLIPLAGPQPLKVDTLGGRQTGGQNRRLGGEPGHVSARQSLGCAVWHCPHVPESWSLQVSEVTLSPLCSFYSSCCWQPQAAIRPGY